VIANKRAEIFCVAFGQLKKVMFWEDQRMSSEVTKHGLADLRRVLLRRIEQQTEESRSSVFGDASSAACVREMADNADRRL
jgi:hypothetical protein